MTRLFSNPIMWFVSGYAVGFLIALCIVSTKKSNRNHDVRHEGDRERRIKAFYFQRYGKSVK